MKRVALVYTFGDLNKDVSSLGGAERRINYIFSNIRNEDLNVDLVFVLGKNKESVLALLDSYLNESAKIIIIQSYYKLFRYIKRQKYDTICYVDCVLQTIPAIWGGIFAGSKRLMILESSNRAYGVFKRGFIEKVLMDWNYRLSNHLDTLYPSSKPLLEKKYGKKRVVTVTPCTLPRIEKYTNPVEKKKYILFAGRLNENKNPEMFVNAAISCATKMREKGFVCLLCGDGPLKRKLADIINESGCADVVELKGYVNMEDITPVCKVFCSLQHTENYPSQSLLEAIASGCYCICTNSGDTKVLVNDAYGVLIDENADSLETAFRQVLDFDDEKWKYIEKNARSFAQSNFDVKKAVHHYENLFIGFQKE